MKISEEKTKKLINKKPFKFDEKNKEENWKIKLNLLVLGSYAKEKL